MWYTPVLLLQPAHLRRLGVQCELETTPTRVLQSWFKKLIGPFPSSGSWVVTIWVMQNLHNASYQTSDPFPSCVLQDPVQTPPSQYPPFCLKTEVNSPSIFQIALSTAVPSTALCLYNVHHLLPSLTYHVLWLPYQAMFLFVSCGSLPVEWMPPEGRNLACSAHYCIPRSLHSVQHVVDAEYVFAERIDIQCC